MIVEILGGALSGQGCANGETVMQSNGLHLTVYDIGHFVEMDYYFDELESLIRHVSTSRVDPHIGEILLPGDPEYRTGRQRQEEGIPIDDTTWSRIVEAARSLGLDDPQALSQ